MTDLLTLSMQECVDIIKANGEQHTVLVEGDMGSGKTSIGKAVANDTGFRLVYFDCASADVGDIHVPDVMNATGNPCVRFVPNENLGLHLDEPIVLCLDELGKASQPVINALLPLMLERRGLHPQSIVFATTNLSGEGVGDRLLPHQYDRLSVVRMRKPSVDDWIVYAVNKQLAPEVIAWVRETPQCLQSFTEVPSPDENPYIFHPQRPARAFVTPRSLEKASGWVSQRDEYSEAALISVLAGTIGATAAMDMMAFIRLANDIPRLSDIKASPATAKLPQSSPVVCMLVSKVLGSIEKDWVTPWMEYLRRLPVEAQAMFVNGVRSEKYGKAPLMMGNKSFTDFARENNYLYSADKV